MLYIFDIDGVLAAVTHLLPLIQGEHKDFDAYYSRIGEALPIQEGLRIADALLFTLYEDGVRDKFYFVTGRSERSRGATEDWLLDNLNWLGFRVHMRSNKDFRPAHEVKHDIIQRISQETGVPFSDMVVFEDDPKCAKMYESLGCYVCHVRHEKAKS
jgi:hypothetical protein